jgi:hypothetical protein
MQKAHFQQSESRIVFTMSLQRRAKTEKSFDIDICCPYNGPQMKDHCHGEQMRRADRSRRRAVFTGRSKSVIVLCLATLAGALLLVSPVPRVISSSNDNFSNATLIGSSPFFDSVDISLATTEFSDPSPACGNGSRLRTVWYQYQYSQAASGLATIVVDTTGSTYDTVLSAYTGSPASAFTSVACNDDAVGTAGVSKIVLQHMTPGAAYSFMVSQFGLPNGILALHATIYPVPPNDNYSGATPIVNLPYTDSTVADYEATQGTDPVPMCGDNPSLRTVWYTYTPSSSGTVLADTTGSSYDTVLNVYSGSSSPSQFVACNDDAAGVVTSQLSFAASKNNKYWFMVSGYAGDIGRLTFHLDALKRSGQITSQ